MNITEHGFVNGEDISSFWLNFKTYSWKNLGIVDDLYFDFEDDKDLK